MNMTTAVAPEAPSETVVIHSRRDILRYLEDNPRNTPRVGILFAIAMTSVLADAYDLGSLSIGVSSMTQDLGLTATQIGFITSATALGALASALAGGIIADRTGRYKLFIICAVLLTVAPIGICLSVNFWMVLFFRVILGIAIGLDMPVAFSFMAEL
ncbi:MFS transporter, partial [Acidipropionibacterium jensenii]